MAGGRGKPEWRRCLLAGGEGMCAWEPMAPRKPWACRGSSWTMARTGEGRASAMLGGSSCSPAQDGASFSLWGRGRASRCLCIAFQTWTGSGEKSTTASPRRGEERQDGCG